ncbi:hypothetical protein [Bradyrhizobium sp. I1.7.5]|uniref:hypothetical protein n=1 Tax=Bradyrhizobium sp. I1.7.5 TaxID=3156363 RepID=UPI003391837D
MEDMRQRLEKLRTDAAECALIRDLATDVEKCDLFPRLAEHLDALAGHVEQALQDKNLSSPGGPLRAIR